jgi:hypothetical protein
MILLEKARHTGRWVSLGQIHSLLDAPQPLYLHSYVARCEGEGLQSGTVRFLSGCLVFLAIAAAAPQDSFDLRSRYGEPDVERFEIRPGIAMTVGYGTDGKACMLEIEPRMDFLQEMVANETMSEETVDTILDEIVPPYTRGKETVPLGSIGVSGSCNSGMTFGEYDNVEVTLSYQFCERPIGIHSATVSYRRSACDGWQPLRPPAAKK